MARSLRVHWHNERFQVEATVKIHDPIDQGRTLATRTRVALGALAASVVLALAACGGAKEGASGAVSEIPASRSDAARFLTQASFGPTTAAVDRVMAIGYGAWIDEQLAAPQASHRSSWEAQDAVVKAANAANTIGQDGIYNSFWKQAVSGEDQLRQRVAFALSQIFVISLQDSTVGDNPRAVADYMDMLATQGFGNYRDLLEAVSLHPMMGAYLTSLRNRKADPRTGREAGQRRRTRDLHAGRHRRPGQGVHRLQLGLPRLARQQLLQQRLAERRVRPGPVDQADGRLPAVPQHRGEGLPHGEHRGADAGESVSQPEDGARHAVQPPERRPLHRQAADPAPGHQQPEPGLRGRGGGGVQQQWQRRAR
jgi:hypothetical protein